MDQIEFTDLWAMYRIKFIIDSKPKWENFWALKGVSFKIAQGQTVGIIGENGAGKSTVLKIIAGMLSADRGGVKVSGKIAGLLELGAGFQPELTGSENIYLIAGLFGLDRPKAGSVYKDIVAFAEIGKFINAPVKCYSQGMFVRLAFAIAINMDSDILLIDDTLAVGDEYFQKKCIKKIFELKELGKTIVFVTHDMDMLRRLCSRAIFLKEGRIIKDGPSQQVVSLYAQTSGPKEGVAVLKNGGLSVIFNNGRLLFNWNDCLITPGLGGHTVLGIMNKHYNSVSADWLVENIEENKIIARGKFPQFNISQSWRLELDKDLGLKWEIEIKAEDRDQITEFQANLMVSSDYLNWATGIEKGEFTPIDPVNTGWQSFLGNNVSRKVIGVDSVNSQDHAMPALFFQQASKFQNCAQILNTDYLNNCRLLQFRVEALNNQFMYQAKAADIFSGKIFFACPDKEVFLEQANRDFVLSRCGIRLIFTKGTAVLSYNGLDLTKDSHLNTSLYTDGKWYDSGSANWEFKRESPDKISGRGFWPGLALIQVWEFVIEEQGFSWKAFLEVEKETPISEQRLQFMCTGDYKYYSCEYAQGEFPRNFIQNEVDMLQRCIPDGAIGLASQSKELPGISLVFTKDKGNFAKILNSDFYHKGRLLRIEKIDPEEDTLVAPGKYKIFDCQARIVNSSIEVNNNFSNVIGKDRLKFIFENGKGGIFWEGRELTKKLGFYTSLRCCGRWYDSASSAAWKVQQKDSESLSLKGRWLHLPIEQLWQIKLSAEKQIEFNIIMEVKDRITAERLQANLMLSEKYSCWLAEGRNGRFPDFVAEINDDWQQVYLAQENHKYIGVSPGQNKLLPEVGLKPTDPKADWSLIILNSDLYHRGRVLQYLNARNAVIEPGQYAYASGSISIHTLD